MLRIVHHESFGNRTPPQDIRREEALAKHGFDDKQRGTLVIEDVPEVSDMASFAANFLSGAQSIMLTFRVGKARLHPLDDFNRKKGLATAMASFTETKALIERVYAQKGALRIDFQLVDKPEKGFSLAYQDGKRPRLLWQDIL